MSRSAILITTFLALDTWAFKRKCHNQPNVVSPLTVAGTSSRMDDWNRSVRPRRRRGPAVFASGDLAPAGPRRAWLPSDAPNPRLDPVRRVLN